MSLRSFSRVVAQYREMSKLAERCPRTSMVVSKFQRNANHTAVTSKNISSLSPAKASVSTTSENINFGPPIRSPIAGDEDDLNTVPYVAPTAEQIHNVEDDQITCVDDELPLSKEQKSLLDTLMNGTSVYFTGKAGTGKTEVLKRFIREAEKSKYVVVTAPTGLAASHIGGSTFHSRFGIPPVTSVSPEFVRRRVMSNPDLLHMYRSVDALVIDEISMLHKHNFNIIDGILRRLRDAKKPFGGVQMVLSGDFFQLPPVVREPRGVKAGNSKEETSSHSQNLTERERILKIASAPFLFSSHAWDELIKVGGMKTVTLNESFRQRDEKFVNLLDKIRLGQWDDQVHRELQGCVAKKLQVEGVIPTRLCGYRRHARDYNLGCLNQLPAGRSEFFPAYDFVQYRQEKSSEKTEKSSEKTEKTWVTSPDRGAYKQEFDAVQAERDLRLKVGAQVILIKNKNVAEGIVNGSRGVVVDFVEREDRLLGVKRHLPVVRFTNKSCYVIGYDSFKVTIGDDTRIERQQLPLLLGWGLTIHRSQGMTIDLVEVDISNPFVDGLAYVALSRARGLDGLSLRRSISKVHVACNPDVQLFHERYMMKR